MTESWHRIFQSHRDLIFSVVYRMTGSYIDAEDIVHDTFIRWQSADKTKMEHPKSWLVKVATNITLDFLKSARYKREVYAGPWLPEPYTETSEDLDKTLELEESITTAFLIAMEKLSPLERVSFILHDIFHYSFREIASFIDQTEASCRKQASRARKKLSSEDYRHKLSRAEQEKYVATFYHALQKGDINGLKELLTQDAILYSDGGGVVQAAPTPIEGRENIIQFLCAIVAPDLQKAEQLSSVEVEIRELNNQPSLLIKTTIGIQTVFQFHYQGGEVSAIFAQRNPNKLAKLMA